MSDATTPLLISNKYEVLARVGRGGMGTVYKVRHTLLQTIWALKTLDGDIASNPDLVRRFEQEARSQAQLDHPNIVKVLDFDRDGDLYYFVMDFVDGPTLGQVLRERKKLPLDDAVEIGCQLASALRHAHTRPEPVTHRDIKPGNVLLERVAPSMFAKLTDFGIAKVGGGGELTQTGAMLASFRYGAPEQLGYRRGRERVPVDGRADIYALGIVLFEMIEGRRFFEDLEPPEVVARVVYDPNPIVPEFRERNVPRGLTELITSMVSRDPDDRPPTMKEVESALRASIAAEEPTIVIERTDTGPAPIDPRELRKLLNDSITAQDAAIAARQRAVASRAPELAGAEYARGAEAETRAAVLLRDGRYHDAQDKFRTAETAYDESASVAVACLEARLEEARVAAEGARDRSRTSEDVDEVPTLWAAAGTLLDEAARETDAWRSAEIYERATAAYEQARTEAERRRVGRALDLARAAATSAQGAADDVEAAVLAPEAYHAGLRALESSESDLDPVRALEGRQAAADFFTKARGEAERRRTERDRAREAEAECARQREAAERAEAPQRVADLFARGAELVAGAADAAAALEFAAARGRYEEAARCFGEAGQQAERAAVREAVLETRTQAVDARQQAEAADGTHWCEAAFVEAVAGLEAADGAFERDDLTSARRGFLAAVQAFSAVVEEAVRAARLASEQAAAAATAARVARDGAAGADAAVFAAEDFAVAETRWQEAEATADPVTAARSHRESVVLFERAAESARRVCEQAASELSDARAACDAARDEAGRASADRLVTERWDAAERARAAAAEHASASDFRPAIDAFHVAARSYGEATAAARRESERRQREADRAASARRERAKREARDEAAATARTGRASAVAAGAAIFASEVLGRADEIHAQAEATEDLADGAGLYRSSARKFEEAADVAGRERGRADELLLRARGDAEEARERAQEGRAVELAPEAWGMAEQAKAAAEQAAEAPDFRPAIAQFHTVARLYGEAGRAAHDEAERRAALERERTARREREQVQARMRQAQSDAATARERAGRAGAAELAASSWKAAEHEWAVAEEQATADDVIPAIERYAEAAGLYETAEQAAREESERREAAARQIAQQREEERRKARAAAGGVAARARETEAATFAKNDLAEADARWVQAERSADPVAAARLYRESTALFERAAETARRIRAQAVAQLEEAREAGEAACARAVEAGAAELAAQPWAAAQRARAAAAEAAAAPDFRPAIDDFHEAARLYMEAAVAARDEAERRAASEREAAARRANERAQESVRRAREHAAAARDRAGELRAAKRAGSAWEAAERARAGAEQAAAAAGERASSPDVRSAIEGFREAARLYAEAATTAQVTSPAGVPVPEDETRADADGLPSVDPTVLAGGTEATQITEATGVADDPYASVERGSESAGDLTVVTTPAPEATDDGAMEAGREVVTPPGVRLWPAAAVGTALLAAGVAAYVLLRPPPPPPVRPAWDLTRVSPGEQTVRIVEGTRQEFVAAVAATSVPGAVTYAWRVDGVRRAVGETFTLEPGFDGRERTQTVAVVASGSWGELAREWTVDIEDIPRPPAIEVATPAVEVVNATEGEVLTFSVTASDPDVDDAGDLAMAWTIDGEPVVGASGDSLEVTAKASVTVAAVVRDPGGLEASRTWEIEVAAIQAAPEFSIVEPKAGVVTASEGERVSLRAKATDSGGKVTVRWDPGALRTTTCVGESCQLVAPVIDRPEARYPVSAIARNDAGEAVREWTIRVRQAPPTVRRVRPASRSVRVAPDEAVRLEVAGRSAADRAMRYEWTLDGRPLRETGARASLSEGLSTGRHVVTARAVDDRGLRAREAADWQIEVASIPPSALAAAPPPTLPAPGWDLDAAVRAWVRSYERAWESGDVAELRRLGVITNAAQEESARKWIDQMSEPDVLVSGVTITPVATGEAATVRFTRKDRDRRGESPGYPVTYVLTRRGDGMVVR